MSNKLSCSDCGRDIDLPTMLYGFKGKGGIFFKRFVRYEMDWYKDVPPDAKIFCKKCAKKHRNRGKL